MQEWLLLNKEWVFSGVGISVTTITFSILSAIVTLWLKSRQQKKSRKKLQIISKLVKFDLSSDGGGIDSKSLLVSYKSKEYKHLCHYSVKVNNIGDSAIENQTLLFTIPESAQVVETSIQPSHSSISTTSKHLNETQDIVYTIDRLEGYESVSISYLVNIEKAELIKCTPRGVDNIDYSYDNKESSTNDTELLVMLIAVFIFVDMVPLIGSAMQSLIVFVSAPVIVRMVRSLSDKNTGQEKTINFAGDVYVNEKATLVVDQKN